MLHPTRDIAMRWIIGSEEYPDTKLGEYLVDTKSALS
jgi:hypothetical protein